MSRSLQIAVVLLFCFGVSLGLRTLPVASDVFRDDEVRFQETDPWYHVRLIENTVRHFPWRMDHDPYALAPEGHRVPVAPLFDQMVAAVAWVAGAGAPSEIRIHHVAAWFPAVFGAVLVFIVYFIGRSVFDRQIGLFAAGLVALLPGVFLRRTSLGYVDHHAAETLFSALVLLFLILALNQARIPDASTRRVVMFSVLFGVSLAGYLLSWIGGMMLVFVLIAWVIAQFAADRWRGCSTTPLVTAVVPGSLVALVAILPGFDSRLYAELHVLGLLALLAAIAGLSLLGRLSTRRGWTGPRFAVLTLACAVLIAAGSAVLLPGPLDAVMGMFRRFFHPDLGLRVEEVRPLLASSRWGVFSSLWGEFTTGAFLGAAGFLILVRRAFRSGNPSELLVLIWTVLMTLATLVQVRFGYYLAIEVALLSALACAHAFAWATGRSPGAARPGRGARRARGWAPTVIAGAAIFMAAYYPNFVESRRTMRDFVGPTDEWIETLRWLRGFTPPPVADARIAATLDVPADADAAVPSSPPLYSVMNWWDYGYWVLTAARRIPVSIPTQAGAGDAAAFYLAQTEREADTILDTFGSRYVLVDYTLPIFAPSGPNRLSGKFRSLAAWAGQDPNRYYEEYRVRTDEGGYRSHTLFYPEYFRSMCVRLYLFEGRSVPAPAVTLVITFERRTDPSGVPFKEVTSTKRFATYAEAREYVDARPGARVRIVSDDARSSCVPIEPLRNYRKVHGSPTAIARSGQRLISFVEVFEYGRSVPVEVPETRRN